jgi:hypothetical protein
LQLVALDLRGIDAVDGHRQIEGALLGPRRGDDDRVDPLGNLRHGDCAPGCGQQSERA